MLGAGCSKTFSKLQKIEPVYIQNERRDDNQPLESAFDLHQHTGAAQLMYGK